MKNILYDKRVRRKNKSWWTLSSYYESEKISLREKIYTYLYNFKRNGLSTIGEVMYFLEIENINLNTYKEIESDFNKDYIEYLKKPTKPKNYDTN